MIIQDAAIYINGEKVADVVSGSAELDWKNPCVPPEVFHPRSITVTFPLTAEEAERFNKLCEFRPWYQLPSNGKDDIAVTFDRNGHGVASVYRVLPWWKGPPGWFVVVRGRLLRSMKRPFRSLASGKRAAERKLGCQKLELRKPYQVPYRDPVIGCIVRQVAS